MNFIGQLQVNQGDVRFIHVGFVTFEGGFYDWFLLANLEENNTIDSSIRVE